MGNFWQQKTLKKETCKDLLDVFCVRRQNKISHIVFGQWPFVMEVWKVMLKKVAETTSIPRVWQEMFVQWNQKIPWQWKEKSVVMRSWMALPKYLCWVIWIAHNQAIFNNIHPNPIISIVKAQKIMFERIIAWGYDRKKINDFSLSERDMIILGQTLNQVGIFFSKTPAFK